MTTAHPKTSHSAPLLLVAILFLCLSIPAQAQLTCTKLRPCDRIDFVFENEDGDPLASTDKTSGTDQFLSILREYTQAHVAATRGTRIRLVYGIGQGESVEGPYISNDVIMVPGEPELVERGGGPLDSPWDAFDDPLVGFDDPLVGFDDPLVGFDDPLVGFDDPLVGFDDPLVGLETIWGNGGTYVDDVGAEFGIILFSMTVAGRPNRVLHSSAIVPVTVEELSPAKRAGAVPEQMALEAAYPNPFNPQTTIRYALPEEADVRLAVYDLMGREVAVLAEGMRPAGTHSATFEASGLPSGVYLYRLEAGAHVETRQMTLIK